MSTPTVRIRGVYATAMTKFLLDRDWEILQMSKTMEERFRVESAMELADIDLRQNKNNGLMAIGKREDLEELKNLLKENFLDICYRMENVQLYGIYKGKIEKKKGKKTIVDIKDGRGICYESIKDGALLQVFDMKKIPILRTKLTFPGKNIVLIPNRAVKLSKKIKEPEERERLYDLGKKHLQDFGILFRSSAVGKDEELVEEIKELYNETEKIMNSYELFSTPSVIREGHDVLKIYFGWDAKRKLDSLREDVVPTMQNHHLYKNSRGFSKAVDLGEKIIENGKDRDVVEENFLDVYKSSIHDYVKIEHIKEYPVKLGDAKVLKFEPPELVLKRKIYGRGYYDGLNRKKEHNDYVITEIEEEKWYFVHKYYSKDGKLKGKYYNICSPVEIYPRRIRYIDLEVDVVENPEGERKIIDQEKLEESIQSGRITEDVGKKAMEVAETLVK